MTLKSDEAENSKIDFFVNGVIFYCKSVKYDLFVFKMFHNETEAGWENRGEELQNKIEDYLESHPEERYQEIVESFSEELHQNQITYPSIHRESLVITIYNSLEAHLNELCRIISESINNRIKLKDLNGRGIERAFLYLTKVGGFDLSRMGTELA